jgi:hypothetical protein
VLLLSGGCSRGNYTDSSPASNSAASLDSIAREYVRLALALGERDPDSLDFSIAPEQVSAEVHQVYAPTEEIARTASLLAAELHGLKITANQRSRADFLLLQLGAMQERTRMLRGHLLPFDSEAQALFATTRLPDTNAKERRALRAKVAAILSAIPGQHGATYSSPAARYAAYDRRFLVPPDRLAAVMHAALASCRLHSQAYLTLPAGESIELTFVRNKPWSAFSKYRGRGHSTIEINLDLPVTVDDVLELACHEGYPGHHLFNTMRDLALVQQRGWPEAEVQLTFSPQSYVSEAAAAYAPRLVFSTAERTRVERDILFPLAGLPRSEADRYVSVSTLVRELDSAEPAIAREYVDGRLEFVRAEGQLASELLMEHAEASLLYLNEYRTYMLAYTDGPRRISNYVNAGLAGTDQLDAAGQARTRWERYAQLMEDSRLTLP